MAHRNRPSDRNISWSVIRRIADGIYVLLITGVCTVICTTPLALVFLVFRDDLRYYPLLLVATVLSAPGLSAAFSIFRDHPALFSKDAEERAERLDAGGQRPEWIAEPYVLSDAGVRVIKPYFRSYAKNFARSLIVSFPQMFILFAIFFNIQILGKFVPFAIFVPVIGILSVLAFQSLMLGMILVVEYPKARWLSVIKNAYCLLPKRFFMIFISVIVLAGYILGISYNPILIGLLGTGIALYVIWASARWQMQILDDLLQSEDGNERKDYSPNNRPTPPPSSFLSQYQQ